MTCFCGDVMGCCEFEGEEEYYGEPIPVGAWLQVGAKFFDGLCCEETVRFQASVFGREAVLFPCWCVFAVMRKRSGWAVRGRKNGWEVKKRREKWRRYVRERQRGKGHARWEDRNHERERGGCGGYLLQFPLGLRALVSLKRTFGPTCCSCGLGVKWRR